MNGRFVGIGMSAFLSIASVVLFFNPGLNYGIDFVGGIQVEGDLEAVLDLRAAARQNSNGLNLGEVGAAGIRPAPVRPDPRPASAGRRDQDRPRPRTRSRKAWSRSIRA